MLTHVLFFFQFPRIEYERSLPNSKVAATHGLANGHPPTHRQQDLLSQHVWTILGRNSYLRHVNCVVFIIVNFCDSAMHLMSLFHKDNN